MKLLKLIFVVGLMLFANISNATSNDCQKVSEHNVEGVFTIDCINAVLTNYVTYKPGGYFIISLSEEENIYVQGYKDMGNSFLFEAVGPSVTNALNPNTVKSLMNLGWTFPDDSSNFVQILGIDEIFSQKAAKIVFKTLESYSANPEKIRFEYQISDFRTFRLTGLLTVLRTKPITL